jgi:transcriptional regulator with XRE-family HTH domain
MDYTAQAISNLYTLAKEHKIRAYQIANEAGITRVTLSNWKSKRSEPTLSAFLAAQHALDRLVAKKQQS